ncbi:MAG: hypothetical protein HYV14_07320 [Elusimicrobia bacterium]|nr:hypothetical protein [Elusimicrobiota bacterium]
MRDFRRKLLPFFLLFLAAFTAFKALSILLWREQTTAQVVNFDLQRYRTSWGPGINGPWITFTYSAGGKTFTDTALTVSRFKTGPITLDYCRWKPDWNSPSGEEWFDLFGVACLLLAALVTWPSPRPYPKLEG